MMKRCLPWMAFFMAILPGLHAHSKTCDSLHRPLVLVHGFLGAGDNFGPLLQKLQEGGYCTNRCFVYDWNTMERVGQSLALDRLIDSVLQITGAPQVDLIGHSAGGGVAVAYLDDSIRLKKVARYVHIGSSRLTRAPALPTLNIYSAADYVVRGGYIEGATNLRFSTFDHFQIICNDSVSIAIFEFLNQDKKYKPYKLVALPTTFEAKGRVLTLGQNAGEPGSKLTVKKIDPMGNIGNIVAETITGNDGGFAINGLEPFQSYLIYCQPPSSRKLVYYFPKIRPDENLLYLRTLPSQGMVSLLLNALPADSSQAVLVLFSNQRAIVQGRDELIVQGRTLSTPELADAAKTGIAWFLYDGNGNGMPDGNLMQPLSNFPFLRAVDMRFDPKGKPVYIKFAGQEYRMPLQPASEAINLIVLMP